MHSVDGLKLGVQELQRDLTLRRCLAKEAAINTLDDKISGVEELLSKHLVVVEQKQPDLEKVCTAVYPSHQSTHHSNLPITAVYPSQQLTHHISLPITAVYPSQQFTHHISLPITAVYPSQQFTHHSS